MKLQATCNWADCWKVGDVFEALTNAKGFVYIHCRDRENGPQHNVDNGGEVDLTPADILAGKSTQFKCVEV